MESRGLFFTLLVFFGILNAYGKDLADVGFEQRIGASLPSETSFIDEKGKPTHLAQYLGIKPVILSFVYFGCPNLCTLVLNGMVDSINLTGLTPGKDFDLLSISINPNEKPPLALAKKRSYLARLSQTGDENPTWHFLTGSKEAIQKVTNETGFHFKYDPISKEYNHPSGFIILSPTGRISSYFFGLRFDPNELKKAIAEATIGKSHRTLTEVILNCFHYTSENGKYGKLITEVLRAMSLVTILALGGLFFWLSLTKRQAAP